MAWQFYDQYGSIKRATVSDMQSLGGVAAEEFVQYDDFQRELSMKADYDHSHSDLYGMVVPWTEVSYGTAWSDYGVTYGPPQYAKIGNTVMLRGLAKKAAGSGDGTICTLPAGCRPPTHELIFPTYCSYGGLDRPANLYVNPDGRVRLLSMLTGGGTTNTNPASGDVILWATLAPVSFSTV